MKALLSRVLEDMTHDLKAEVKRTLLVNLLMYLRIIFRGPHSIREELESVLGKGIVNE